MNTKKAVSAWLDYGIEHHKFPKNPDRAWRQDIIRSLKEVFNISTRRAQEYVHEKFGRAAASPSTLQHASARLSTQQHADKEATLPKQLDLLEYRKHTEERIPVLTDELSRRLFRTAIADYAALLKKREEVGAEEEVHARIYGYVKDGTTKTFNTRSRSELEEAALIIYLRTNFEPFLDIHDVLSGRRKRI